MAKPDEEGAPVPADAIDPELVKLERPRSKIGIVTSLGVVILCVVFLLRLGPDRSFAGQGEPATVTAADVADGKVGVDELVTLEGVPTVSHAIRATKARGDLGQRFVPVRGTGDRVWLALPGDGWDAPIVSQHRYTGRVRKLSDSGFGTAVREHASTHPRPVFARVAELRAAFATNTLKTVGGEQLQVRDDDRVAFDLVEPSKTTLVASLTGRVRDTKTWLTSLASAGIPATAVPTKEVDAFLQQARFEVALPPSEVTKKLAAAQLWAARVEPVTVHHATTWRELKTSPHGQLVAAGATIPEGQVDLVGVYAQRDLPEDAYVILTTERPEDYWYVMPITIVLIGLGLLFAWALVRAVRRDLLPA